MADRAIPTAGHRRAAAEALGFRPVTGNDDIDMVSDWNAAQWVEDPTRPLFGLLNKRLPFVAQAIADEGARRDFELAQLRGALEYILDEFKRTLAPNTGGQQVPCTSRWSNCRQLPSALSEMRWCIRNYGPLVGIESESTNA